LLLSLFLHGALLLSLFIAGLNQKPKPETVQFEIVDPSSIANLDQTKIDRTKKMIEPMKNQIVDQDDRALNDEKPEDSRFLSKNNQVVRKQTVAKDRGEFKNKQTQETERGEHGKAKNPSMVDLKPKFDVAKAIQDRIEREQAFDKAASEGFIPMKQQQASAKKANEQGEGAASKGGETSQTLDYIKDLDPGLETLLSTKEFVYYSYFNRIRNQLNQYWTDKVRQKLSEMYKKGRSIASSDDKITKCLITLDTSGKLIRVQIIGDSGVHELDEAAVEAFKAAAPFPNPPKGMVDPDGTIKIRWNFILEA
jgi:protein TonB